MEQPRWGSRSTALEEIEGNRGGGGPRGGDARAGEEEEEEELVARGLVEVGRDIERSRREEGEGTKKRGGRLR